MSDDVRFGRTMFISNLRFKNLGFVILGYYLKMRAKRSNITCAIDCTNVQGTNLFFGIIL